MLFTYGVLRLQGVLPLNPQGVGALQMPEHLAFNTAVSFTTNTNWQSYSTGEVIFGGVGAGLYGMLMFAVLAVFIAGLMVGRTPEYIGKKIEKFEVQMAMLATLVVLEVSRSILSHPFTDISGVVSPPSLQVLGPVGTGINCNLALIQTLLSRNVCVDGCQ